MKKPNVIGGLLIALAIVIGVWVVAGLVVQVGLAAFGITFTLYQCVWIVIGIAIVCSILKSVFGGNK